MKTIKTLLSIFILLSISNLRIYACTSFAVYSNEIWYGMNFDYPSVDVRFSISLNGNKKIFRARFGTEDYIAGMNDSGLFTNYQLLYYNNGEPTFNNSSNTLGIGDLNIYSINNLSSIAELEKYIGTKRIIPSWGQKLHSLIADKASNAIVVEPSGSSKDITSITDSFIVMTNFPNYDFIGKDYNSVHGVGSDRYKAAYTYIKDHKTAFSFSDGLETLKRTAQSTGDFQTQISLLFDPINTDVYFCMKRNFSKVWKVSLKNETIETFSGFDKKESKKLDANGIWFSSLVSSKTSITELDNADDIRIYPNPTSSQLNIALSSVPLQNTVAEIYNTEGILIMSKTFRYTSNTTIDLAGKPKGLYFVKILSGKDLIIKKFYLN